MLAVRAELKNAETVRKRLAQAGLLDAGYLVAKGRKFIYFPVREKAPGFENVRMKLRRVERRPRSLREALAGILTGREIGELTTSFDIIGDIAIIEIPEELAKKEKEIGKAVLAVHKNIRTVCSRAGAFGGVFRVRPLKIIAGKKNTETEYRESGARMRTDVAKVYFSPRLSFERERIAKQVKPGEVIGAFFAGVGPFPLVIFRRQPDVKIYAIELNPDGVRYLEGNIRLNKAEGRIIPIPGDVSEAAPKLGVKFDRILMPLPKGAENFLDAAFSTIRPNGIIHFYNFAENEKQVMELLEGYAKAKSRKIRIIASREVRAISPRVRQYVVDFTVLG